MGRLRSRLFEPADRHDVELASRRGLLAGLFQSATYLVAFGALFGLGLVTGVVQSGAGETSTVAFWAAVGVAGVAGAGIVALATNDQVSRVWRVPAARLVTVLVVYAAFWGLLLIDVPAALVAGPTYVAGRVFAHGWLVLTRS